MGRILVGTASWTDPTLIASGDFYPPGATGAEEMLRYYASRFPMVEVDSTYYALPSERNARLWVERTPDEFVFDVKAFALMTTHPTEVNRLPVSVREMLTAKVKEKSRVYAKDLPPEALETVWEAFISGIRPLHDAGKLGAVFLQFPKWFPLSRANKDYILSCKERLRDYRLAVEFRQNTWLSPQNADETLNFLRRNDIAYTAVDEPQGFSSSVPPVPAVTSGDLAVVRMHGRNAATWEKPGLKPSDRFNYLYNENELREWLPDLRRMADETRQLHVVFNNNFGSFAVTNASQLEALLES